MSPAWRVVAIAGAVGLGTLTAAAGVVAALVARVKRARRSFDENIVPLMQEFEAVLEEDRQYLKDAIQYREKTNWRVAQEVLKRAWLNQDPQGSINLSVRAGVGLGRRETPLQEFQFYRAVFLFQDFRLGPDPIAWSDLIFAPGRVVRQQPWGLPRNAIWFLLKRSTEFHEERDREDWFSLVSRCYEALRDREASIQAEFRAIAGRLEQLSPWIQSRLEWKFRMGCTS